MRFITLTLAVVVRGHEDGSTALGRRALATETLDLAVRVDLVVLENGHLDLLADVLDLLGGGVGLPERAYDALSASCGTGP